MLKNFKKRIFSSILMLVIVFFLVLEGRIFFNFSLVLCLLITFYEWYKISKKKILLFFFGLLWINFSFYSTLTLRNFDQNNITNIIVIFFILLISISSDIGGYIFGKTFKGPKLTSISPNKTIIGVFGAYLLTVIVYKIYTVIIHNFYSIEIHFPFNDIFFILLFSTISQIGDLIVSYFKRLSNVKDTGNIIPGHGGLIDRIDGMIFLFPFVFIIINLI